MPGAYCPFNNFLKEVNEDNAGENLGDLGYVSDFLGAVPKAWSMKEIIDKLDFIKIKNFCFAKYTVKR